MSLNHEEIRKMSEFFEEYNGYWDMTDHKNCPLCVYSSRLGGVSNVNTWFSDHRKNVSDKTGISAETLNIIFLNNLSSYNVSLQYGVDSAKEVTKEMVIAKIKREFPEAFEKSQCFSKKDLKSGMFVVQNQGNIYQVVGDKLVSLSLIIGARLVSSLEHFSDNMETTNYFCNIDEVYEPLMDKFYHPDTFLEEYENNTWKGGYEKVYDRKEIEEKDSLLQQKESLEQQLKEINEKLGN